MVYYTRYIHRLSFTYWCEQERCSKYITTFSKLDNSTRELGFIFPISNLVLQSYKRYLESSMDPQPSHIAQLSDKQLVLSVLQIQIYITQGL